MSAQDQVLIFLGVGSNVLPERNLRLAWRELGKLGSEPMASAVYRNTPVGFEGDDFLNLVVRLRTRLSPPALLAALEVIHALAGRQRGSNRFGPRELDIDLLLYGDVISRAWKLPRKDLVQYPFVLKPMAELAAELRHPVSGHSMAALWQDMAPGAAPMQRVALDLAQDMSM